MNGEDLFRGLNYVNAKFIDEAENVIQLQGEKKILSLRRPVLIAAIIAMLLMLVGCGAVIYLTLAEEPWASIPRVEGTDVSREDIQITVTGVSPTGLSYHCDIDGFGTEEKSVFLYTDAPCVIEKKTDDGWQEIPKQIVDTEWTADKVLTDGHFDGTLRWTAHYGYLDVGVYRITASIVEGHDDFVLEFEITEAMRNEGLEMAEDLANREFWHIREICAREYGSLENVPDEVKEQYMREDESADDSSEYWKCGEDYLYLMYDGDNIIMGMMYKDGIKYKLVREWESNDAPIVGWMPWPDMDLNRVTGWRYVFETTQCQKDISRSSDGSIETVVLTNTEKDANGFDLDVTYTYDIHFDGNIYNIEGILNGEIFRKEYRYLLTFLGQASNESHDYDSYIRYVLSNEPYETWEKANGITMDGSIKSEKLPQLVYTDLIYETKQPKLPANPAQAVLEFNGAQLVSITDFDHLEKIWILFQEAEYLGYEPKTHSVGVGLNLILTSQSGETMTIELDPDGDICRINGEYVFYGAYDEPDYIEKLWYYLGIPSWPDSVYEKYPNAYRP